MLTMDWASSDHLFEDSNSQNTRTRPSSAVSPSEASLLHSSRLAESPKDEFESGAFISSSSSSRPPSRHGLASPACNIDDPRTFLSTPNSRQEQLNRSQSALLFAPVPSTLHGSWFDTTQPSTQGHPQVRLSPATNYSELPRSGSPATNLQAASMSTVALQYSSTFDMAGRAPFSWPVMDSHNMLGHDLGSYSAATGVPPPGTGSRSVTGSPPRMFTAEQRELKRQQDQARRDSKISQRQRRTDSGSSYVSSPPLGMSEVTTGVPAMPIYSTASSQIPMLAEPAASATTHQYLSTYSSPIPMSNQFPNQYAAQPYMYTPDYQASSASAYPAVVGGSLPTQYGRTSMSDPSLLYQSAPPALPMGVPESQGNSNVRVVHSRPKPQCWEHGCNGRQFSTFSNLLRHQREKSGQATKATCPNCGAEFTRTTARNGHLLHDKCRGKRNSRSESVSGNKSE